MKALIATNHLGHWTGSELIAVEMAEALNARGWSVTLVANVLEGEARRTAQRVAELSDAPETINAFEFAFVWSQHCVAPLLQYSASDQMTEATLFAFAHLSPFEAFEMVYSPFEDVLADQIMFNSHETMAAMSAHGADLARACVFHNAAPEPFWVSREAPQGPRSALIVSNHLPDEVSDAAQRLRALGVEVEILGMRHKFRRISAEDVTRADVVLTIGKTVQMAIASRTPVYVYDQFGGPGYLGDSNFERAAAQNFSGRCSQRRLSGDEIAAEIIAGFPAAVGFMSNLAEEIRDRFRLVRVLDALLRVRPTSNAARLQRLGATPEARAALANARANAELIRRYYRGFASYRARAMRWGKELNRLKQAQ